MCAPVMSKKLLTNQFFKGLQALAESAFPKRCANCGRVYRTAKEFLEETQAISPGNSGLKSSTDEEGGIVVEVFRNCICGSTLMDCFSNRRDISSLGVARRKRFGELLEFLVKQGVDYNTARTELLKILRGESSLILSRFRPPSVS